METQISIRQNENVFTVGIAGESGAYFLWQSTEAQDDGVHLALKSGELLHLYFNDVSEEEYEILVEALKKIYIKQPSILQVI